MSLDRSASTRPDENLRRNWRLWLVVAATGGSAAISVNAMSGAVRLRGPLVALAFVGILGCVLRIRQRTDTPVVSVYVGGPLALAAVGAIAATFAPVRYAPHFATLTALATIGALAGDGFLIADFGSAAVGCTIVIVARAWTMTFSSHPAMLLGLAGAATACLVGGIMLLNAGLLIQFDPWSPRLKEAPPDGHDKASDGLSAIFSFLFFIFTGILLIIIPAALVFLGAAVGVALLCIDGEIASAAVVGGVGLVVALGCIGYMFKVAVVTVVASTGGLVTLLGASMAMWNGDILTGATLGSLSLAAMAMGMASSHGGRNHGGRI